MYYRMYAFCVLAAGPVFAWGCHGHQTITLIALQAMTPDHASATNALLAKFPSAIRISCGSSGLPLAAQESTWADDFRRTDSSTGPWHFIDMPLSGPPDLTALCAEGCVTRAIKNQIAVFQGNPDSQQAADALRFLIHLVADAHQPLHAVTNNDRGGNCIPVGYLKLKAKRKTGSNGSISYDPELHSVWDKNIVDTRLGNASLSDLAATLSAASVPHRSEWGSFSITDDMEKVATGWAQEGHDAAVAVTYANLVAGSHSSPIDASAIAGPDGLSSCDGFQDQIAKKKVKLNQHYVDASMPTVELRLEQAGIRLAVLLDQLWVSVQKPPQ
jgi:hypothetical protein